MLTLVAVKRRRKEEGAITTRVLVTLEPRHMRQRWVGIMFSHSTSEMHLHNKRHGHFRWPAIFSTDRGRPPNIFSYFWTLGEPPIIISIFGRQKTGREK